MGNPLQGALQWPAELLEHRGFLQALARQQLGHGGEADDVAHDTLIAAAAGLHRYSREQPLRAWLVGILRHKIIDVLRARKHFVALEPEVISESAAGMDGMFTDEGTWNPQTFSEVECPESQLSRQQLLTLVEWCMQALPEASGRVFLMREYLGMDTDEIVAHTALTPGNLRVMLHRARLRLRACVVRGWGETR